MIKSMTGFAQTVFFDEDQQMTLTVRTYNNRYLDTNLRLSSPFSALEDRIKTFIASQISRGRVEVSLQSSAQERKMRQGALTVNWPLAEVYWGLLQELKKKLDIPGPPDLTHLLSMKDLFVVQEKALSEDVLWKKMAPVLKKVFQDLQKMRLAEGHNLKEDLQAHLTAIVKETQGITERVPQVVEAYRQRLEGRLKKWAVQGEIDPNRLTQEVAIMADRSDISEELARLGSHVKQFKTLFQERQPVGKKMEFLLQEMNREVNTIGSKSLDSLMAHQVVSIKAELEKLREQVQNIE
jgi:uncharacterized protein (TIGR00255 family)